MYVTICIFIDETDETENRKIHFERYPSKTIERVSILIHIRNDGDRVPLPTTSPLFLSLIPISSLLHRRYSTVNNIDSVIYPTIQNHSLRYQATKEERKKKEGGKGEKRSGRKREREEKRKNEGKVYQTRRTKKERQIFTQPWLEIPWSLSYTLFNAIEFPLPSLPKPLPPSSRAASLSVGLECTAVTAYTATRSRLLRRVSLPLLANLSVDKFSRGRLAP